MNALTGPALRLHYHRLGRLSPHELRDRLFRDGRITGVEFEWVEPGERVRVLHVLDAIAPAERFPGFVGPPLPAGGGVSRRVDGVAVVTAALIPGAQDGLSAKEAILDTWGPGADLCPLAGQRLLVVLPRLRTGVAVSDALAAVRLAGLEAAAHLAQTAAASLVRVEEFDLARPVDPVLPGVVLIAPLMREGAVHASYVYGEAVGSFPIWLHPNELLDGAVVSGDYHVAATRSTTYFFQENALIRCLYRHHGNGLRFLGVIAGRSLVVGQEAKERSAWQVARLARLAGASGAVLGMSAGGHGIMDLHLMAQKCETLGVRTVLVQAEMGDDVGSDLGLVGFVPEADAIVSVGNRDEVIALPESDRVVGGDEWNDWNRYEQPLDARPGDALLTPMRRLFAATEQFGAGRLSARPH